MDPYPPSSLFPFNPSSPIPKVLAAVSSALLRKLVLFEMHIPQAPTLACVRCWVIVEAKCLITHGRPSSGRPHRSRAPKQRPSFPSLDRTGPYQPDPPPPKNILRVQMAGWEEVKWREGGKFVFMFTWASADLTEIQLRLCLISCKVKIFLSCSCVPRL